MTIVKRSLDSYCVAGIAFYVDTLTPQSSPIKYMLLECYFSGEETEA